MKQTARKLLSLLMAFAIMLTLAPAALADDPENPPQETKSVTINDVSNATAGQDVTLTATLSGFTAGTYSWSVSGCGLSNSTSSNAQFTVRPTESGTLTVNLSVTPEGENTPVTAQAKTITVAAAQSVTPTLSATITGVSGNITLSAAGSAEVTPSLSTISATPAGDTYTASSYKWSVTPSSGSTGYTISDVTAASPTITFTAAGDYTISCVAKAKKSGDNTEVDVTVRSAAVEVSAAATPDSISFSNLTSGNTLTMNAGGSAVTVTATVKDQSGNAMAGQTVSWSGYTNASTDGFTATTNASANTITITPNATLTEAKATVITATVGTGVNAKTATFVVTVSPTNSSITVNASSTSLRPGTTGNLTIVPSPTGVTVTSATWTVSNPNNPAISAGATLGATTTTGATNTITIGANTAVGTTVRVTVEASLSDGSKKTNYRDITVASPVYISTSTTGAAATTHTLNGYGSGVTLYARVANDVSTNYSYTWSVSGNSNVISSNLYNGYNSQSLYIQAVGTGTARVTVTVTYGGVTVGSAYIDITVQNTGLQPSVTVYRDSEYVFSEKDKNGNSSVADQIASLVRNNTGRYLYSVVFSTTTSTYGDLSASRNYTYYADGITSSNGGRLSDIVFTPRQAGTATFSFTAYYATNNGSPGNNDYVTGVLSIKVDEGTSGGDITYSASLGEDVYFNVSDFESFWTKLYSRGTLSYVTFGSVSGGTVYNSSNKSVGSTSYYANPTRSSQSDLDGVYFTPNSTTAKKATTIRIPFSAYGSTTANGSTSTTPRTGTIVITYLSAAADKIPYTTNASGTVSLKAQDFIDAYKAATNTKTNPTNLTIVFQGVPSYGTLTYTDSSKKNSSAVKLTSSNIKSRSFTTKTSGTNQIGDVTYTVSGSRTDTISYIGYIGSTATFTGEVTFNAVTAPTDVRVSYTCYTSAGVALTPSYFTSANAAMANASYVILGTPKSGRLVNSNGATAANTAVQLSLLGSVTYVPGSAVGVTTDSFIFTAYNSSNVAVASGTVNVTVSLPANPGAITSIAQFTDIPAAGGTADWYRTQLIFLINQGVINGKGDGKFAPEDAVEYSEALKFIMNAAGYYEEQSTVGNWAQNYKNTAVAKGWIQNSVDLTKPIGRDAMAELAAKILGIAPSTAASPFVDSSNQYAVALYYANPRIIQGSNDLSGRLCFTPTKALSRDEMVCLVYNMYRYLGRT